MSTEIPRRPYRKQSRAESERETRRRIASTAAELHGTLGPARTTISAIAQRAGVRRSTVYRHFPDEPALYAACSAHWYAANPQPDPARWEMIEDPDERLAAALEDLYGYFERVEAMMDNLIRDEPLVESVDLGELRAWLAAIGAGLAAGRPRRAEVGAAAGHAVAYSTWKSLAREQGLPRDRAVELMRRLVAAA